MTVLGSSEWKTNIFPNGTNISVLKFTCGILNRGMAYYFWNHVIKISSIHMYFQDIYSNLWKVKIFTGNIYSLKSNTYFWGTVMFVQDGFLYLIVTRHKLTVLEPERLFLEPLRLFLEPWRLSLESWRLCLEPWIPELHQSEKLYIRLTGLAFSWHLSGTLLYCIMLVFLSCSLESLVLNRMLIL